MTYTKRRVPRYLRCGIRERVGIAVRAGCDYRVKFCTASSHHEAGYTAERRRHHRFRVTKSGVLYWTAGTAPSAEEKPLVMHALCKAGAVKHEHVQTVDATARFIAQLEADSRKFKRLLAAAAGTLAHTSDGD